MKVSELIIVKLENLALKIQLLQNEQQVLLVQARTEVQAPEDHVLNLQTREFQAP